VLELDAEAELELELDAESVEAAVLVEPDVLGRPIKVEPLAVLAPIA